MKCKNCGHLNKNNTYYCVKCGSSLDQSNPIRQYKQSAKDNSYTTNVFSRTQKFIIALVIIGILIVIFSAVTPPDLELPALASPGNTTQDEPVEITEDIANKLNTTIQIGSISAKTGEKVTVNAYVSDENGDAVKSGSASINLFDVKYSGQVENGNVYVVLPELSENNYETSIVYEGNDQYNPSEAKVSIQVNRENTKIEANTNDDEINATLKTESGKAIPDAKIVVTKQDNTQTEQQTDSNGQINIKLDNPGKQQIKLTYQGNEKYNPTETTIEAGKEIIDTKLETKYDEKDKTITVTLLDKDNNKISDASLIIINNNHQTQEKTNNEGIVKISLNAGDNHVTIKYDGNGTYNKAETTVNTVIEPEENQTHNNTQDNTTKNESNQNMTENNTENNTENITENSTQNTTVNDTENSTDNTTVNDTDNITDNTTVNDTENITENTTNATDTETKMDTTFKVDNKDNQTIITLLSQDNEEIGGESIKITLDNGTVLNEKTNSDGTISLNIDLDSINEIKLEFDGNSQYNSNNQTIRISH